MQDHIRIQLDKPFQTLVIGDVVEFPIGMAELMIERKAAHLYEDKKKRGRPFGWRKDKENANTGQRNNDDGQ